MADVSLEDVHSRMVGKMGSFTKLIEAAAVVANAIHVGAGAMIIGSLMEAELREALGLKRGELVNITKQPTRG